MAEDSDDKPMEATPYRIWKAMQDGQVGYSSELMAAVVFLTGVLLLWFLGPYLIDLVRRLTTVRLLVFEDVLKSDENILNVILQSAWPLMAAVGAVISGIAVVTLLAGALQTRFNFTTKPLAPKPERLDPVKGFKKLFSLRSVVRMLTSLARASLILAAAIALGWVNSGEIAQSGFMPFSMVAAKGVEMGMLLSLVTASILVGVGVADLGFQKYKHLVDLRMTVQEIRDEQKEIDGNPEVKRQMRQLAAERLKKSLATEVPRASVIITNPTHFAVAVRYDIAEASAPVVIAKGTDHLARRIIELAREHGIPVVERKPVARFLFYRARVGKMIPIEMYMAVAEILNFVARRKNKPA